MLSALKQLDIVYYISQYYSSHSLLSELGVTQILDSLLPYCPHLTSLKINITVDWRMHQPGSAVPSMCLDTLLNRLPNLAKQQLTCLTVVGWLILTSTCTQRFIKTLTEADFAAAGAFVNLSHLMVKSEVIQKLSWETLPQHLISLSLHEIRVAPTLGSSLANLRQVILSGTCSSSDALRLLESFPRLRHLSVKCLQATISSIGKHELELLQDWRTRTSNSMPPSVIGIKNGSNCKINHESASQPIGLCVSDLSLCVDCVSQFSLLDVRFIPLIPPMHGTLSVMVHSKFSQINPIVKTPCVNRMAYIFPDLQTVTFADCASTSVHQLHLPGQGA